VGLRRRFPGRRWAALAATAAAVVAISGTPTSSATPSAVLEPAARVPVIAAPPQGHRTSTTSLGGLIVTVTVKPWRAKRGAAVQFNLSVSDTHATGALGYLLVFGDGSSTAPAMPMYCLAAGRPAHETWQLSHRYLRAGHYKVMASGFANCGSGRVTATVNVEVL